MKNFSKKAIVAVCAVGLTFNAFAGNKDRSGQAGAPELLINPWARSTGLFGMNVSSVVGMEAMKANVAGMAMDTAMDIGLSQSIYLSGTHINISNLGLAQPIGKSGVLGFNIMSMGFGDIPATDFNNPEGYGTYQPTYLNISIAYAKQFSAHINAGFGVTYVSEQMNNISATGAAFDGGIQYFTGKRDNFHFGITLRNIGTNMRFTGTGFSVNAEQPQASPTFAITANYPSDKFEMPTYLNIGSSYDFFLDEHKVDPKTGTPKHRLSVLADFQSNSFNNDFLGLGVEYSFINMVMLRAAYRYENGIGDAATSTSMYVGIAAGATVQKRLGDKGPMLSFDYSFRPTQRPANGVHVMSLRLSR